MIGTRGLVVSFFAMLAAPAFSQTAGTINGTVSDSSGSVIVGAKLTVKNPQTNFTRNAISNESGNYSFPELAPGIYDVRAEMQGFQAEVRTSVELQVQQTARIDFRMSVGAINQTVEVAGGAPLLDTENATVGTVIENKRIVDLPLNGRSFVSLIALSPNVVTGQTSNTGFAASRGSADRGSVSLSISGMRREYTYYTLDGISNLDFDFNTYALLPSIDALQEFKVQSGVYSAEFGREAAQVNVSTQSGTNGYHGTVFEFLRNNNLDALPYAFTSNAPVSSPFKWNQFGFTLGGPVQIPKVFNGKDRLFFMSNYEGFRLRSEALQVYSVPSAAMRTGNFSQILPNTVIKDPLNNNQPFSGNIIPSQRLDPIAKQLLAFYPSPNVAGAGLGNNYLGIFNDATNKDQFTQRIDFIESPKSNWFGRYSWQEEATNVAGPYLTTALLGSQTAGIVATHVQQAVISNSRILSPSIVNEFRFGYMGFDNSIVTPLANKENVNQELGIPLYLPLPSIAGTITSTRPGVDMRELQFSLKLLF